MTDQSNFINSYIDVVLEQFHSLINADLQLRTQLKVAGDVISNQDKKIQELEAIIKTLNENIIELKSSHEKLIDYENTINQMKFKVQESDGYRKQCIEMKETIKELQEKLSRPKPRKNSDKSDF